MKNNRIQPLEIPLSDEMQSMMDKIFPPFLPSPNLYRIVAKNKELFKELVDTKTIGPTGLFDRKRLPPTLREKIILRTCVISNNQYEFSLHVETISMKMGFTSDQIQDIQNAQLNHKYWNPEDLALFELIDGLVKNIKVSEKTYSSVAKYFKEEELIEIVHLIGLYTGVSMMVALVQPKFDNYKNLQNDGK